MRTYNLVHESSSETQNDTYVHTYIWNPLFTKERFHACIMRPSGHGVDRHVLLASLVPETL